MVVNVPLAIIATAAPLNLFPVKTPLSDLICLEEVRTIVVLVLLDTFAMMVIQFPLHVMLVTTVLWV